MAAKFGNNSLQSTVKFSDHQIRRMSLGSNIILDTTATIGSKEPNDYYDSYTVNEDRNVGAISVDFRLGTPVIDMDDLSVVYYANEIYLRYNLGTSAYSGIINPADVWSNQPKSIFREAPSLIEFEYMPAAYRQYSFNQYAVQAYQFKFVSYSAMQSFMRTFTTNWKV